MVSTLPPLWLKESNYTRPNLRSTVSCGPWAKEGIYMFGEIEVMLHFCQLVMFLSL